MLALLLIAALTIAAASAAFLMRNLIHSALLLVGAWAGVAAFYLWAGAEFIAFAQVMVYVGAVSMVVLFAVLLTRQAPTSAPIPYDSWRRAALGFIVGGGVMGLLAGAILGSPLDVRLASSPAPALSVKQLGALLMGPHAAALLVVGLLLTVALLGAVVIAAVDKPEDAP